jgi:ribonuclease BN (tRNA processing enzyme)
MVAPMSIMDTRRGCARELSTVVFRMSRVLFAVLGALIVARSSPAQAARAPHSRTHVVMLGTGNPAADPDRYGPATVIIVDSTAYLVDAGVGVVRRWAAAIRGGAGPFNVWDLRRLFITHLHSDHTLGYADLILSSWTLADSPLAPLRVFGPKGTRAMTEHLLAAYAEDIGIRSEASGDRARELGPQIDVQEIAPGEIYHDSLVTVTAFHVHHGTWEHSFGFRFQTPDKDIVISGDAAPPSAIPAQCHQCDILIHEGGMFHRGTSEYQTQFHTSIEDLIEVALASRPKLLVLYHQRSGSKEAQLQFLRARYHGRVVVANDLDVFQ